MAATTKHESLSLDPATQLATKCQLCHVKLTADDPLRHDAVKLHQPYCHSDNRVNSARVVHFCGVQCPVVLCLGCIQTHVAETLETVVPGVLPEVCCPVCLKAVNKARWELLLTQPVVDKYVWLCHMACMVRWCDGCSDYTCPSDRETRNSILPFFPGVDGDYQEPMKGWWIRDVPTSVWLTPQANRQMPAFRSLCRQFSNHRASAEQVLSSLEDIADGVSQRRESLYYMVLQRLPDEERRAALVLTYHGKYPIITCNADYFLDACFRCKHWVFRPGGVSYHDDMHPDETTCNEPNISVSPRECPFHHNSDCFWCPCGAL